MKSCHKCIVKNFTTPMAFIRLIRRRRSAILKLLALLLAILCVSYWLYTLKSPPVLQYQKHNKHSKVFPSSVGKIDPHIPARNASNVLQDSGIFLPKMTKMNFRNPALLHKLQAKPPNLSPTKKKSINTPSPRKENYLNLPKMKVTPGLGEKGEPVHLPEHEVKKAEDQFTQAAFNVYLSDRIALNRTIPDPRNPKCQYESYDKVLPSASVIIIFTNEIWSALLRTIHSVINRTPSHLLHEIILVDVIDDQTFEYYATNLEYFQIGGFTWDGHFTWIEIPDREEQRKRSEIEPTRSPTMAGGLFAIDRDYFWEIGSYDSGMEIWGGENLEMSFRVWMCGGSLEIVPCSHVGHIFRNYHPYKFPGNKDTHGINTVRTVEVWMDEYKKYFYYHRPDLKDIDYGDISPRLELKHKLKCKSFKWYLNEIYPEKFIFDKDVLAYGSIRNPISKLCLDTLSRDEDKAEPLGLYDCLGGHLKEQKNLATNQLLSLTLNGELRIEENCAVINDDTNESADELPVIMTKCHEKASNQKWTHKMGGPIVHESGRCIDVGHRKASEDVVARKCNGGHFQVWWFENYLREPKIRINENPLHAVSILPHH